MTQKTSNNSFETLSRLEVGAGSVFIHKLSKLGTSGVGDVSRLPFSIKVLLEAALRSEDGLAVTDKDIVALAQYNSKSPAAVEVPFTPARVLVQDFTGVPALVDLAAMRSAMARLGGDPQRVNPVIPVDLVIDHSVQVDAFGAPDALEKNSALEFERNKERYEFLHWGQRTFDNLRVVPPSSGICHQVNLEHLATVVRKGELSDGELLFSDSLVGLDSHTTMIGGLGILGWGVGGIEAEAAMLGQPLYMLLPEVVGFRLNGQLPPGSTATDLALVVTQILRNAGVVGKFVEFFGSGLSAMSLPDRATIANMAPEYGATASFFPVDDETLRYLEQTGRPPELVELVQHYCRAQGLFRTDETPEPAFASIIDLDLSTVNPSLAGPRRPQDRIEMVHLKKRWRELLDSPVEKGGFGIPEKTNTPEEAAGPTHGSVVVAAITSCTNTSNPDVLLASGILAKNAVEAGLSVKPYVKTSLAPGSKVVTAYLEKTGLLPYLEKLGFHVVGYGCTTCIGNSGPLPDDVAQAISENALVTASVLSGNRNFEGRIHSLIKANFLASPPLVVAYALAGTVDIDLTTEPLGLDGDGNKVFLRDIWPSPADIKEHLSVATDPQAFRQAYAGLFEDNETWNRIEGGGQALYPWDEKSTYIKQPPFFLEMTPEVPEFTPIERARVLVKAGDSVTTDHISPAGSIPPNSPAGNYLMNKAIPPNQFNSYGSRRGNDQVMTRGTFANIRLRNQLAKGREGGWTTHLPTDELVTIYEAAQRYQKANTPTIVLAGKDYGMGSSRDWAAKGTLLLGARAVIATSFERIHRSNLVGMGVLPLQFLPGEDAESLGLTGKETFSINLESQLQPGQTIEILVEAGDGSSRHFNVKSRLDTGVEIDYYQNGGILPFVLRQMLSS